MPDAKAGRSGGAYIPPYRLKQLQAEIEDKSSEEYQKLTWEALKKSINGLVNKVAISNIAYIIPEVFSENLVRGRGLFCRAIMKAQMASPSYTHVYAALVAIINTKMPELGELLLSRVVLQFRRAYRRNDKPVCKAVVTFIAHLVNQQVAHELLALQLITVLLEKPTDDSVELAIEFIKSVGATLQDLSPAGLHAIMERMRSILHESEIDKRVQYMIEGVFAVRKKNFEEFPSIAEGLDLVEEDDRITHEVRALLAICSVTARSVASRDSYSIAAAIGRHSHIPIMLVLFARLPRCWLTVWLHLCNAACSGR